MDRHGDPIWTAALALLTALSTSSYKNFKLSRWSQRFLFLLPHMTNHIIWCATYSLRQPPPLHTAVPLSLDYIQESFYRCMTCAIRYWWTTGRELEENNKETDYVLFCGSISLTLLLKDSVKLMAQRISASLSDIVDNRLPVFSKSHFSCSAICHEHTGTC